MYLCTTVLYRSVLSVQRQALGKDHPNVLTTITSLAMVTHKEENAVETILLLQEALTVGGKAWSCAWRHRYHTIMRCAWADNVLGAGGGVLELTRWLQEALRWVPPIPGITVGPLAKRRQGQVEGAPSGFVRAASGCAAAGSCKQGNACTYLCV